ncbi:MAG: GFA family protein [Rhizobiales bacterium]|nr:GFA family protein [Hyphomicrobiales bacterium]
MIMFNCHCRDCQQASGSAYAPFMVVPRTSVQMRGEPRYYKIVGGADKAIERGFCPTCGSQVSVKLERLPDILALHAGSLDDPSIYRPMMDAFTSSAQPWDHMNPNIQKHARGLPARG